MTLARSTARLPSALTTTPFPAEMIRVLQRLRVPGLRARRVAIGGLALTVAAPALKSARAADRQHTFIYTGC
jgi:hypothetical protein